MTRDYSHVKYDKLEALNPSLVDGMKAWIEGGYPPGGFLRAILANNLSEAVGAADYINEPLIPAITRWLYNEAPSKCWGSPEKVEAWYRTYWPEKPGNRLDDGSNEAIADREDLDDHELEPFADGWREDMRGAQGAPTDLIGGEER